MTRYVIERAANPLAVLLGILVIFLLPTMLVGAVLSGDWATALICAFFLLLVLSPLLLIVLFAIIAVIGTPAVPPEQHCPGGPTNEREEDDPRFWTPKNGVWL